MDGSADNERAEDLSPEGLERLLMPPELLGRFAYHAPSCDLVRQRHETIRSRCRDLALLLHNVLPNSREQSIAITKLEEVMFWANEAIARHQEKL